MADSGDDPAAGELRVAVLGPLDATVDGQPVVVTAPRLRTLLAVLATSAGRTVPVHRLAMAVWDEELPLDTRGAVQTYMTRLRGLLGAGLIRTSPGGYALCAEPDQIDALRFLRLLAVLPGQVGDAAGGWLAAERGVGPMMVIPVQPCWQGSPAGLL